MIIVIALPMVIKEIKSIFDIMNDKQNAISCFMFHVRQINREGNRERRQHLPAQQLPAPQAASLRTAAEGSASRYCPHPPLREDLAREGPHRLI